MHCSMALFLSSSLLLEVGDKERLSGETYCNTQSNWSLKSPNIMDILIAAGICSKHHPSQVDVLGINNGTEHKLRLEDTYAWHGHSERLVVVFGHLRTFQVIGTST